MSVSRRRAVVVLVASVVVVLFAVGGEMASGSSNFCGATGVLSGSGAGPLTCTYDTVGSDTFTVPPGVTSATLTVVGAVGGNYFIDGDAAHPDPAGALVGRGGGAGGEASGILGLTPGSALQVDVAGAGGNGTAASRSGGMSNGPSGGSGALGGFGGSNGGVSGGAGDANGANGGTAFDGGNGAAGGGSSDVRLDPSGCAALTCGLADRVFVGAGGGGSGGTGGQGNAIGGAGGSGGGASGADGGSTVDGGNYGVSGDGGTPTAGGAAGLNPWLHAAGANPLDPRFGQDGANGASGPGGAGGAGNLPCNPAIVSCGTSSTTTSGGGAGGGAGGGYFGGGGGSGGGGTFGGGGGAGGGGGGGSSYAAASATNPVLTANANANTSAIVDNSNGTESYPTNGTINSGNGQVTITWTPVPAPTVSTAASVSVPVGGQITDSATLSGGNAPTGTVTFNVYGPGDASCTTPLGTSTATATGDGTYQSAPYTPSAAGTYQWVASYGGDANNAAVPGTCGASGESVTVTGAVPPPGAITGTITNTSGTPLSNICVYVYGSGATGPRTSDPGVCTNASGNYVVTVASAGSYDLAFYDPTGTYPTQWYNGASSQSTATAVTVTSDVVTSGVNATMTQPTEITGTVTDTSGSPLSNICVYLYASGATGVRTSDPGTCTGSNGAYAMPVGSPGQYNVVFVDPSGTYLTQWNSGASSEATASALTVTAGAPTTGVNATMTEATEITGTVTNASGSPLANICVYLYASGATGARTGDTGTCTASNGTYAMPVATAGSYNVVFYDPAGKYLTQWNNGAATEATATAVTVAAGALTTGVNATMVQPTDITGTVTNASGNPLANICVYLYGSGATGARTSDPGTCTNASGQYAMPVGAAGSFNVAFFDPTGQLVPQWYTGATSEASATAVTVTAGATTTGVNAAMLPPMQITGTVTNASGTPLANICVYLYNSGASGTRTGDTGTCTNAAGQYAMTVASAGSYNVVFYDPTGNYFTQWYKGAATEAAATAITVSGATSPNNINAQLLL